MRARLSVSIFLLLLAGSPAFAVTEEGAQNLFDRALLPGEVRDDIPLRGRQAGVRADTTWYGQYELIGGDYYAIAFDNRFDGRWTFDRGTGPFGPPPPLIENGEGWWARDLTQNELTLFRVIDATLDLGEGVGAPIIAGEQSLWVGVDAAQAESLCYSCGPGYGNNWNQRCSSPALSYNGSGDVILSFLYFSSPEPCYDGVQIYLKRADESELMLNPYPGECPDNDAYEGGDITDSIGHYTTPATYIREITAAEIGEAQEIRIVFEFTSDGGWSDQDCDYTTIWGPFGTDNIFIAGGGIDAAYDFEDGLQGWTPVSLPGIGSYAGIADVVEYTIQDDCDCEIEGNILEMHDGVGDAGFHPVGQHERVVSPICVLGPGESREIFMQFDMYAEMPLQNGVLLRPGWRYYPYTDCNGALTWSPRVGENNWRYVGDDPDCDTWRFGGTDVDSGTPVPPDAEMVIVLIDLQGDCEAFGIDDCSEVTNFTPIYDNISVAALPGMMAPTINFDVGGSFMDVGSYPSTLFDPRAPGPANIVRDLNMNTPPGTETDYCGDTLVIAGPQPGTDPNNRWEARLWWRVAKRAPFQADYENGSPSRYKIWKDRTADGRLIDRPDRPEFAWAWMDSVQVGSVVTRNKFYSAFREDDDDFVGENNPENEIIWDDILYPGSQIEYFVTANYTPTPNDLYYRPDTTGGYFREFEILPSLRTARVPDCGGPNRDQCVFQAATLYIDAYGRGGQLFIENALRTILNGLEPCIDEMGCAIPRDRNWDRYDYDDACSCWNAPFMRGSVYGSNNGMTLNQILGYRAILINNGTLGAANMHDVDYLLFDQWLTSSECGANLNRQVFIINGDKCGEAMWDPGGDPNSHGQAFMLNRLGASPFCDAFNGTTNDADCGVENTSYCVRLLPVDGGAFDTELDIDAYGNHCPNLYGFNAYNLYGGAGNRYYYAEDGLKEMDFAQVTNEDLAADANYRTVLSSPSWHHLTARDAGGQGLDLCPRDLPSIVAAEIAEIGDALKWGFDVDDLESIPKLSSAEELADCQDTWNIPSDVEETAARRVNRLYQNEPNPFQPATTIRFSLAQAGAVEIAIYDVNGRRVRTLIDGRKDAGLHSVLWDGTNDAGKPAGSGIYWSQMKTGAFVSNKKVAILR